MICKQPLWTQRYVIKVVEYGCLLPLHSGTAGISDGQGKREVALGECGTCLQTVGDGFIAAAPLECVNGLIVEATARRAR